MVATSVLLDRTLTMTTFLSIALDPISSLAVISTFLQPHPRNRADYGAVVALDRTSKTKPVWRIRICTTCDDGHDRRQGTFGSRRRTRYRVRARGVRTVLEIRIRRYEMSHEQLVESLPRLWVIRKCSSHEGVRCHKSTALSHASDRVLTLLTNLTRDIGGPAPRTKGVVACKCRK